MKKIIYIALFAISCCVITSCTEENVEPTQDNNTQTETNNDKWK